jgi:hypothetical protein
MDLGMQSELKDEFPAGTDDFIGQWRPGDARL